MSATLDGTQAFRFPGGVAPTAADDLVQRLDQLNAIGASLSAERDINRLLEAILTAAKTITRADGGTLYRVADDKTLRFEIVRTSSLKYYLGGTTGNPVPFYPIQLYKDWVKHYGNDKGQLTFYKPVGCDKCGGSGFKGRCGLHELLIATDKLKKLIQEHARVAEMLAISLEEGMRTLKQDGMEKCLTGVTHIKEVRSVCIK